MNGEIVIQIPELLIIFILFIIIFAVVVIYRRWDRRLNENENNYLRDEYLKRIKKNDDKP